MPRKLRLRWMLPQPALFIWREAVKTFGASDTLYRIVTDYDAVLRWFGGSAQTSYIPEVWVKMRIGGASNTRSNAFY